MDEDRITIRIDTATKQELAEFAKSVGMTSSRVIRVLIKQSLRERRILILNKIPGAGTRRYLANNTMTEDLE